MNRRILVIEDHEDNRRILRDLLTAAGYDILEAVTGQEGIAKTMGCRPDLILMDIQLPLLDGYEVIRRLKADPATAHIPIVAVTSYALSGDEARARAAGCDAYIAKPYSPRALLTKIREFVP
jgi:two-component system cell cycle response regulator DivK